MTDPNMESLDFKRGWGVGYQEACEDLMSSLMQAGVTDDEWNGGDVVTAVCEFLHANGVDTE